MTHRRIFAGLWLCTACSLLGTGCSASGSSGEDATIEGPGGTAPVSGSGAVAASGGAPAPTSGTPSGFSVDEPAVMASRCNELEVQFEKIVPTVAVLVDRSKSMFESNGQPKRAELWEPLFQALTDVSDGVIPGLQKDVRFGFTAYNRDASLATAACPNLATVPIALDNAAAITQAYEAAGIVPNDYKWDTPTAASLLAVTAELTAFPEPGPKHILLVTDGNPDRCDEADPQCGQDDAIAAVQAAHAAGITTFVVGIGDVALVEANADQGCWGRCGALHLQDLANAGRGLPVVRNTDQNFLNNCFNSRRDANGQQQFVATYVDEATLAGDAPFYVPSGRAALRAVLSEILSGVRSCTFSLLEQVRPGQEQTGTVLLDGEPLVFGASDGWTMPNGTDVQLTGGACERVQNEVQSVDIFFPCEAYIR